MIRCLMIYGWVVMAGGLLPAALPASVPGPEGLQGRERVEFILRNFYTIYSADFDRAIALTGEAVAESQRNGWTELEGFGRTYRGVAFYLRGNHEEALAAYLEAERLFEQVDSDTGRGRLYNEMAVFYSKRGEQEKAYEMLARSRKAAEKVGDLEAVGTSDSHRAAFLMREGKVEEAHAIHLRVLDIRRQSNDSVGLGYVYLDLAEYELNKGRLEEANRLVEQSSEIREAIGDRQGLAVNTVIMGEHYSHMNRFAEAVPWFRKAVEMAGELGYTDLIRFGYEQLQHCYLQLGDYRNAYEAARLERAFNDSLFNIEKTTAIQELQTRYETEKKDREIENLFQARELSEARNARNQWVIAALVLLLLLSALAFQLWRMRTAARQREKENERRLQLKAVEMNAMISSQEKERRRIAADLHDGLGQLVAALSLNLRGLQQPETERDWSPSMEIVDELQAEIRNIAFHLMPPVLSREGLVPAIRALAARIGHPGEVRMEVHSFGMEDRLPENVEIAVFRVVQEWISNVLRYNTADRIHLDLTRHEEEVVLLIEDNGRGFDPTVLENGGGNGWRNIHSRITGIGGRLDLETAAGRPGTSLIIRFPIPPHPETRAHG